MNPFEPLIRRPAGSSLLAIGLAIAGFWAYLLLGVAVAPSMEFPFILVTAQLPGASAQTMASTVMEPLERHLGRISGVSNMTGSATDGSVQIGLELDFSRSADKAARDVQAAINAAEVDLPTLPTPPRYFKISSSNIPVLMVAITSSSLPPDRLFDLANTLLKPNVAQIPGVGQVQILGSTAHSVRITLHTRALNSAGLTANDVVSALRSANVSSPKGTLGNGITQMRLIVNDTLKRPQDFSRLIIASRHGVTVRLSDVATVSSGQQNRYAMAWFNGQRALTMKIAKRSGANTIAVVKAIRAHLPELRKLLPADIRLVPIYDSTTVTESALREVGVTLLTSIVMVALVMLLFLRRARPTLIAMLTVPLSLAGAMVVMWAMGFTLNLFSLVALVLCVGFVVDDAVVVIENIVRHMEQGMKPLPAALTGVREISFTIISITLSLIAVFGPIMFGDNLFTRLMREFSVTLIATIIISAMISLSLTPALCGHWLTDESAASTTTTRWQHNVTRFDRWMLRTYERSLDWALGHRRLMRWQPLLLLLLTIVLAAVVAMTAGGGFLPRQDNGLVTARIIADVNISPNLMASRTQAVAAALMTDPAVRHVSAFLDDASGNESSMFIELKPLGKKPGERRLGVSQVVKRLRKIFQKMPDISVLIRTAQLIPFSGGAAGVGQYSFDLQSTNGAPLQEPTLKLAKIMRSMKQFQDVSTSFDSIGKQQILKVNRHIAARLHVSMGQVDNALTNAFSQRMVSTIYAGGNQSRVVLSASNADSLRPADLLNTYVRSSQGRMIPLSALARIKPGIAPIGIDHFNQVESSSISYNLDKGVSQASGLNLVNQAIYAAHLPAGIHKRYTGTNQNLMEALGNALITLLAVIASMYVVLGILYESLIHPLTIISTLPAAGMGAFLAMLVTQTQITLMSVISVLMLIGIVKKNAILMVDFALVAERKGGLSAVQAIREAALVRFRPITMTTLVAMGAALPLAIGFGQSSELRRPLGIAILGGLLVSQLLTLLSTPAIYLWQHDHRERRARRAAKREARAASQKIAT